MSDSRTMLRDNDTRFIALASKLTAEDWAHPSLCDGWTNHDVLAHLVDGYSLRPSEIVTAMARHRGSFDRANVQMAHTRATRRSPAELLADLTERGLRPPGIGRVFPRRLLLGDHVIHELDIVLPLGVAPSISAVSLIAVLQTQVSVPNPFVPARARARGLHLIANDVDWSHGSGPEVSGPAASLASVLAGRPWAVDALRGDGVAMLRAALHRT